jgi:hypothetical protein
MLQGPNLHMIMPSELALPLSHVFPSFDNPTVNLSGRGSLVVQYETACYTPCLGIDP